MAGSFFVRRLAALVPYQSVGYLGRPMDTEANPRSRHGGDHPISIFITSLSAAIVVAGGFCIIIEAFIVAGADLFQLGQTFVLVGSIITGLITLWLFA